MVEVMLGLACGRWFRGVACCAALVGCGPSAAAPTSGGEASSESGSTLGEDSTGVADSSGGEQPTVDFPPRLLWLRNLPEGGRGLGFVELGDGSDLETHDLHPELAPTAVVEGFEVLSGTEFVALRARASADAPAALWLARAQVGAEGTAATIALDGEVTDLAWASVAGVLVVVTTQTSYRIDVGPTSHGEPVELVGSTPSIELGTIHAAGTHVAGEFGPLGARTCHVASLVTNTWTAAYDDEVDRCAVVGFTGDAVVLRIGDDGTYDLVGRALGPDGLQSPVTLAAGIDLGVLTADGGAVYRAASPTNDLFWVAFAGGEAGVPEPLSASGTVIPQVSADGRHLAFVDQGVTKVVGFSSGSPEVVAVPLPSPLIGNSAKFAVSRTGDQIYTLGIRTGAEYWEDRTSLWRHVLAQGGIDAGVQITETSPTSSEVNPSSIDSIAVAPDGTAVAYVRNDGLSDYGRDVALTEFGDGAPTEVALANDAPTSRMAFSSDGAWLIVGDGQLYRRSGERVLGGGAVDWRWWESDAP